MGVDAWRPALSLRLIDLARGIRVSAHRPDFARSQWWPRERQEAAQAEYLAVLLAFARDRIPFYRELSGSAGASGPIGDPLAELARLPVVTKDDMKRDPRAFVSAPLPERSLGRRTGGSTGEPFRYDVGVSAFSRQWAAILRAWEWSGYRWGDPMVTVGGGSVSTAGGGGWRRAVYDRLLNNRGYDSSRTDAGGFREMATDLKAVTPRLVYGYPSTLCEIARIYAGQGAPQIGVEGVVTTSEMLFPGQRRLLAEGFGCEPHDMYGCNEVNLVTAECGEHDGYHVAMECCLVEVVDDQGQPVPDGTAGRIIATGLHNRNMVFLRYDTGDLGTLDRSPCRCGRGLVRIRELQGRARELVRGADGTLIHGVAFNRIVLAHAWIERYQVVQAVSGHLRLNVLAAGDVKSDLRAAVVAEIRGLTGLPVEASWDGDFERTSGNKTPVIVSHLAGRHGG